MSMFADMTLQELNALAERQRRQIEEQEKSLQAKQKKLSILTQQSQQNAASDDRLRKLRERAMEQVDIYIFENISIFRTNSNGTYRVNL